MATVSELAPWGTYKVAFRRWIGADESVDDTVLGDYWTAATALADGWLSRSDWESTLPRAVVVAVLKAAQVFWESRDRLESDGNKLVFFAATADRAQAAMAPLLAPWVNGGAL